MSTNPVDTDGSIAAKTPDDAPTTSAPSLAGNLTLTVLSSVGAVALTAVGAATGSLELMGVAAGASIVAALLKRYATDRKAQRHMPRNEIAPGDELQHQKIDTDTNA